MSASIDNEGRGSALATFRLTGFGDRLVFPAQDQALIEARARRQIDFVKHSLSKMAGIKDDLPPAAYPGRTDDLWRSTCLEVFARWPGGRYAEFNIAPSGRWAAYSFDGYRSGMTSLDAVVEVLEIKHEDDYVELTAILSWSGWPHVRAIGLSAVVETVDDGVEYWALAHPAEKPDFHHPESFTLSVRPEYS